MKRYIESIIASLTVLALLAVFPAHAGETKVANVEIPVVKCSAPAGALTVLEAECKAAACEAPQSPRPGVLGLAQLLAGAGGVQGVGKGVSAMLSNALKETGCFKIIDLERVKKMQERLAATGQQVAPPKIDFTVAGTITSIEVAREGGALLGGYVPLVGMVSKSTEQASMSMEVAVIDPQTLEVSHSRVFQADSEKSSWGFGAGAYAGGALGGGGWSISKSLSLDRVTQEVVFSAANFLSETLAGANIVSRPAKKEGK